MRRWLEYSPVTDEAYATRKLVDSYYDHDDSHYCRIQMHQYIIIILILLYSIFRTEAEVINTKYNSNTNINSYTIVLVIVIFISHY